MKTNCVYGRISLRQCYPEMAQVAVFVPFQMAQVGYFNSNHVQLHSQDTVGRMQAAISILSL